MPQLMDKIPDTGKPLDEYCKYSDNKRILFERIHGCL